ncbi:TspO/MBR family protein [Robiginitalea sp. SC105]|uniref:TspO/MBR family protein n=1 Tax=Robiginitalea sp. SC105 TaxID=2762332 RepID=UPI00163A752E|nr:TspO/MBR family protein [Robiginitalea sp. SC105]MBC2837845.1 tryptophan-rich sensory protein [Robiginitalea sp. SC105]
MQRSRKKYIRILISVGICLLIGLLAAFATQSSVDTWYPGLAKPTFTPPNSWFGPVWTILYILMGVAAGLVWARGFHHIWVQTALYHFGIQLLLNGTWSLVFFGLRQPAWALAVIAGLVLVLVLTIRCFRVVSKTAAWLLVPYLAWVLFATLLNLRIVQLN